MSVHDPLSRFVIGIDLGTTNCAAAFIDTAEKESRARMFAIPQIIAPGEVEARETLPSFLFQPAPGEFSENALRLPWQVASTKPNDYVAGIFARDQGANAPARLIHSAKSWLSHAGVDRTAELLPWHGAPDAKRIPPVEASARYLRHLREAWNFFHREHPLEQQDVVITIPASFDEVARELTVSAAQRAGLQRIVLLEEPQAAFYAWMQNLADQWSEKLKPGDTILVCDIGGGTSDFTLIQVCPGENGNVRFHRIAVGEHLILGGDNLDLALAHFVEKKLGAKLEPRQWSVLVRRCQQAKEILLGTDAPERLSVSIPAAGAKLIGGALQLELKKNEVVHLLVDGFLPRVASNAQPATRSSGFREFGLPFAPDPAITRYLAAFLAAHRDAAAADAQSSTHSPRKLVRPDAILFNGGLFESLLMRERLVEVVRAWFSDENENWTPEILQNERLDFAVALGAAHYGLVRRGVGARVSGGSPRAYYIGVERNGTPVAVCLVPAGLEENETVDLPGQKFDLLVRQPVEFPIYVSSMRTTDKPGEILPIDFTQLTPLPPIRAALHSRSEERPTIPVELHARLTEIGTLEVWCTEMHGAEKWKLQFDTRASAHAESPTSNASTGRAGFLDEEITTQCRALILETFAGPASDPSLAERLVKRLEEASAMSRLDWPPSLLRTFWETLLQVEEGRSRGTLHEARWLSLLGFSLRPGYGFPVDDWRVAQTWRLFDRKIIHSKNELCRAEWWILWRRIAGGLRAGQQRSIAEPLLADLKKSRTHEKGAHELAEIWRLLASLEWLDANIKTSFGETLLAQQNRAAIWALGRLGARVPFYGPIHHVVPPNEIERWINALLVAPQNDADFAFALMQMSRRTDDRFRDVSDAIRKQVISWMKKTNAPAHYLHLVEQSGELREQETNLAFGENLPHGLRIR